jgi:hypothetical protein
MMDRLGPGVRAGALLLVAVTKNNDGRRGVKARFGWAIKIGTRYAPQSQTHRSECSPPESAFKGSTASASYPAGAVLIRICLDLWLFTGNAEWL